MSNLPYKNPISPLQVYGSSTVDRSKTFGTTFSVLNTGGFMEVYSLSDLNYTIPTGQTGNVEITGNTIPIQFKKGSGSVFSPDVLTLNSDNISSGRRRLGMLVYVYETNKIYQYTIDNYDNLWLSASTASGPGGATVVISDFGTTVKNNTVAGQNFINAWTASTIEGVSGYTNLNSTWRELKTGGSSGGTDTYVTGFTLNGDKITLSQNRNDQYSAFTITLTGITGTTSGGTLSGNYLPLSGGTVTGNTIFQSGLTANTISATTYFNLPVTADTFVTGFTFNVSNYNLTINQNNGQSPLTQSLSILASDLYVTGGTYNSNTGVATFTNNTGGTFQVTGFLTGFTDTLVTAFTYSNNTFTITDSRGSGFTATINTMTGLTATTISATTYQNLPIDPDTFVTGFTLSSNTITLRQNRTDQYSAFTISLSAYTGSSVTSGAFLPLSGGTVTGNTIFNSGLTANTLNVTGNTLLSGLTASTISATTLTIGGSSTFKGGITATTLSGTTSRMVESSSTGELTANSTIITAYITSGGTTANLLENTSNWDINGVYTGSTITGTFQGQKHYNPDYFFEAVADNLFIRYIRG
jgi:hypothetical protein